MKKKLKRGVLAFIRFKLKSIKYLLTVSFTAMLVLSVPRLHTQFIRKYVGDSMVMLTNIEPVIGASYGGGTGFHIKTPSGGTIIVSNKHVCEDSKAQGFMWGAVRGKTSYKKLKIIELFPTADLCVLEPIEGVRALRLGIKPAEGQSVWAVGHPNLQPRTVTHGEVQGYDWMTFPEGFVGRKGFTEADCKEDNQSLEEVPDWGAVFQHFPKKQMKHKFMVESIDPQSLPMIKVCVTRHLSMVTTIPIHKGNSGSPVVDDFGQVVAVIFAMTGDGIWGRAVTYMDLHKLLLKY